MSVRRSRTENGDVFCYVTPFLYPREGGPEVYRGNTFNWEDPEAGFETVIKWVDSIPPDDFEAKLLEIGGRARGRVVRILWSLPLERRREELAKLLDDVGEMLK